MKRLTRKSLATAAALIVALVGTGYSSTHAEDNPDTSNSGEAQAVADSPSEESTSAESSTTDMEDDADIKAKAASEADSTLAADDETMDTEAETAMSEDTPGALSPEVQYNCKHDASVRTIRVFFGATQGLACEVTYEKSSGTQTLWTAINSKEYCLEKAKQFAAKQVAWGWQCQDMNGIEVVLAKPEAESTAEAESATETDTESEVEAATESTVEPEAEAATESN